MEARAMTTGAVPTPAVGDCSGKHSEAVPAAATSRAVVVLSSGIAVLALLASLGGLVMDGVYGEPASVAEMLRGYDLVTVVIVAPGLLVSQLLAGRKSDRWKLLSIGLLAYLIYTYAYYLFPTSFNPLFLLHVLVFSGSLFALVLGLATMDVVGIVARFSRHTPRRAIAIMLAVLAVSLAGLWVYHSVRFAVSGVLPAGSALVEPDAVVHLGIGLDLAILVPAYSVAAVWLWRAVPAGYILAAAVLVSGALHQLSYMVALTFQATAEVPGAVMFDPIEPFIALLYVVAAGLLLRAAGRGPGRGNREPFPE
jgi:hypothetical protein